MRRLAVHDVACSSAPRLERLVPSITPATPHGRSMRQGCCVRWTTKAETALRKKRGHLAVALGSMIKKVQNAPPWPGALRPRFPLRSFLLLRPG